MGDPRKVERYYVNYEPQDPVLFPDVLPSKSYTGIAMHRGGERFLYNEGRFQAFTPKDSLEEQLSDVFARPQTIEEMAMFLKEARLTVDNQSDPERYSQLLLEAEQVYQCILSELEA